MTRAALRFATRSFRIMESRDRPHRLTRLSRREAIDDDGDDSGGNLAMFFFNYINEANVLR